MTGYPPVVQRWFTGVSPSHATCWPLLPGPWLGLPVVTLRDAHCVLLTGIIVPRTADFFMNFVGCGTVMVMIPGEMADSVTALRAQGGVRAEGAGRAGTERATQLLCGCYTSAQLGRGLAI